MLTAKADDDLRAKLLREGAQDFLTKPVIPEELAARVSNAVAMRRTRDLLQGALSSQNRDVTSLAAPARRRGPRQGRVRGDPLA